MYRTNNTDKANKKSRKFKLGAGELREYEPDEEEIAAVNRNDIWIIVDNVLDTYNIGSIFRLADAVAARGVYLVGDSATPEDPKVGHRIHKASVGTYKWIPWSYANSVQQAVQNLQNPKSEIRNTKRFDKTHRQRRSELAEGLVQNLKSKIQNRESNAKRDKVDKTDRTSKIKIVAIEQAGGSVDYREADLGMPVALVVGHESRGVSKEGLELADEIVEIPLYGVNKSLNVLVALSIICYKIVV